MKREERQSQIFLRSKRDWLFNRRGEVIINIIIIIKIEKKTLETNTKLLGYIQKNCWLLKKKE